MKILIVDDEPHVAEILARSLSREGHSTAVAHSGEEALHLLGTTQPGPDALFLDVSMPGMSGLAVLAEIKRRRPGLPVVVITGRASPEEVEQVRRLGAVDVIAKPAPLTHYQQALSRLGPQG
jgi:CheY-like chemotaxis protein